LGRNDQNNNGFVALSVALSDFTALNKFYYFVAFTWQRGRASGGSRLLQPAAA
jgi:hypothetical protein